MSRIVGSDAIKWQKSGSTLAHLMFYQPGPITEQTVALPIVSDA